MSAIIESSEHHYLTQLDRIRQAPEGWVVLYFSLSKKMNHRQLLDNPATIRDRIYNGRMEAEQFLQRLAGKAEGFAEHYAYMFADHDIVLLANTAGDAGMTEAKKIFADVSKGMAPGIADFGVLANEIYNYQKMADHKILTSKRYESYEAMADTNRVESIGVRRKRREHPVVMVVEDDRFTATYASNILNKDFDLVLCKSGEEAICAYIDHAPDIVLLDIHLPGLNGHETLQCIKTVDPKACVWMLSVDTMKSNIVQATQIGAEGFLKKPFSKDRLLNTVRQSPYIRSHIAGYSRETIVH